MRVRKRVSQKELTVHATAFCLLAPTLQGLQTLDAIFDGRYSTTLQASGGRIIDMLQNILGHHPASGLGPWMRRGKDNVTPPILMALCTRHLFETTARKLLAENPRVQFRYGAPVTGLLFGADSCNAGAAAAADVATEHKSVAGEHLTKLGSTKLAASTWA